MFEVGEKVVCVNNGSMQGSIFSDKSYCLTVYKTYTVIDIKSDKTISIINDNNQQQPFCNDRFMTLTMFRKMKLEKICSRLEM